MTGALRRLALPALALLALGGPAPGAAAARPQTRLPGLVQQVMCVF